MAQRWTSGPWVIMSAEFGADSMFGQLFRKAYGMAVLCFPATESASDRVFKAVKYAMNADSPQRDSARGEQQVLVWRSMHCAFCGSCITRISISSFLLLAKPWDVYFSECISVITGDYVLCTRSWRAEMSSSPSTRSLLPLNPPLHVAWNCVRIVFRTHNTAVGVFFRFVSVL